MEADVADQHAQHIMFRALALMQRLAQMHLRAPALHEAKPIGESAHAESRIGQRRGTRGGM